MRCSYAMISPRDTSPEKGRANVDGAKREEGAVESDCHNQSWASLHLTIA